MSTHDPISDLITRIRNAQMRSKPKVSTPGSKMRANVLEVLKAEGHLRQRLHELLLGIVDVLQLMHKQIIHGLDVFGEESHCSILFVSGTRSRVYVVATMADCSIADTSANRRDVWRFLRGTKTSVRSHRNFEAMERTRRYMGATQDSISAHCGICTGYDSGADPRPAQALSRNAQGKVFALWVFIATAICAECP